MNANPEVNVSSNPLAPSSSSLFDLDAYIARYQSNSETRLQRLLFLALHFSETALESTSSRDLVVSAYKLIESHLKENCDVIRYRYIFGPSGSSSASFPPPLSDAKDTRPFPQQQQERPKNPSTAATPALNRTKSDSSKLGMYSLPASIRRYCDNRFLQPSQLGFHYDHLYMAQVEQTSMIQLQTLEGCLANAQAHLAKESIRMAYWTLGEFHRIRGDLTQALRHIVRSRDYCTNPRTLCQLYLMIIEIALDSESYSQVREHIAKAANTSGLTATSVGISTSGNHTSATSTSEGTHTEEANLFLSKLHVSSALVHMAEGRFHDGALKFLETDRILTNQYNSVVSAEDIATYGGLLSLATLSRLELSSKVLDVNSKFKERLELVPPLRDAIRHYVRSEFRPCLSLLYSMKSDLLLDIRLHKHVNKLFTIIRNKCITQFCTPYMTVSLHTLTDHVGFGSVDETEEIVADLIISGKLRTFKINSDTKTLHAEDSADVERRRRHSTLCKVMKLGDTFLTETESMLLRLSCIENGVFVRDEAASMNKSIAHVGRKGRLVHDEYAGVAGYELTRQSSLQSTPDEDNDVTMFDFVRD